MNERIRELAEQAREYATTRHPVSNIVLSINNDKFEQKFAELIVRECGEYLMRPEFIGRSDLDWSMVLKEHFGVE